MKLSHAETQALISARLDGPLDPVAERELNAHLATCEACRAFNTSATQLARGLQALPYLPASPAVTRAVLDHVSTPRSPMSWLTGSFPANALPAASAIAAAIIVVFVGSFAAFRFLDSEDQPSTIPAPTLSANDLAQRSSETAETPPEGTEAVNTMAAPTDPVEGQSVATDEPPAQPTSDTEPVGPTGEPATTGPGEDEPATERVADEAVTEIGPPPTPTPAPTDPAPTPEPTPAPTADPTDGANIRIMLGLETAVPTDVPTSTSTVAPEPTEPPTPEPTIAPTLEPTPEPTQEPTPEPTAVPTIAPTLEPTSEPTVAPTPEPTAAPTAPTPEPTLAPTVEPTATIVPIIDRDAAREDRGDEATEAAEADDTVETTLAPESDNDASPGSDQVIEPIEPEDDDVGDDGTGGDDQVIEPSGGVESETPTDAEGDPGDPADNDLDDSSTGETTGQGAGGSLASAEVYESVDSIPGGDSSSRLGMNTDGQLVFSPNPGRVSLEQDGISLESREGESGQVVVACDGNDSCVEISTASGVDGRHIDSPIGWLNGEAIYERLNGNDYAVEFRAIALDTGSLQPIGDRLIGGGDPALETLIRPFPVDGALLVPSPGGWLRISSSNLEIVSDNPFGELSQFRIYPSSGQISYVSGGNLILASTSSPGSPVLQVPYGGSDYDFSPDGSRIAVVTGSGIEILDTSGNVLATYPNDEGIAIGSLSWLNQGLVFVDISNGVLKIIQP